MRRGPMGMLFEGREARVELGFGRWECSFEYSINEVYRDAFVC